MKNNLRCLLSVAFLAGVFIVNTASAQEYFRELGTYSPTSAMRPLTPEEPSSEFATQQGMSPTAFPSTEEEPYNMAIGPVRVNVAAGVGLEYNDNVTLVDDNRVEDFIFRPSLSFDATWPLTELNTLRFSIGLSYAKYFKHDEFDSRSVLLSPTSALSFVMFVGPVKVTLRDQFSYQEDPFDLSVVSGQAHYRRWENRAGVQFDWAMSENIQFTAGYDHYNLWPVDDIYRSLERAIDTIYLRPSFKVSPALVVGVNTSVNFINFKHDIKNNGTGYLLGPFVEVELTENTRAYLEGGIQKLDFDEENRTLGGDESSSNSYYARIELSNRLTDTFSHRISLSKTAEIGFVSNFYDLYHGEYGADWHIMENLTLGPTVFYEYYENSADLGEEGKRFGAAIGSRFVVSPSITAGVDYRFLWKDSSFPGADYRQNLVLLSLYYNF